MEISGVIAVIFLGICQILGFAAFAVLLRVMAERKQAEIEGRITEELSKLVKAEPCVSAAVLLAVGRSVGAEAGRSAKASLMADLSHAKRDANLDASDAAAAAVSSRSPALGTILGAMGPRARKGAMTNPLLQLAMQALLGGSNGNGGGQVDASEYTGRKHRE